METDKEQENAREADKGQENAKEADKKLAEARLTAWLRDAHAMEVQAETMLTSMVGRIGDYPDLKQRVEKHIDETRKQVKQVTDCIERRGEMISPVKDIGAVAIGWMQGASQMFVSDEVVKGCIASYTYEHFEIAVYRNLIEAAQVVDDAETQQVCEQILSEKEEMADWLEQNMAHVAHTYLTRDVNPGELLKP